MMMTIVIALLGFVVIAGLGFAFVGGGDSAERAVKRAHAITGQRDARAPRASRPVNSQVSAEQRRKQIMMQLKDADRRERKARVTMAAKLRQAGLNTRIQTFWILSGVVGLTFALLPLLLGQNLLIALGVGFAAGFGLPRWVVGFLGARRMKKFSAEFPNAIDILVRGIKSGLPVHDCLKIIARESAPPLGGEFQRLVENVGLGMTLEGALEKMYERMPTPELRFFAIVVGIQAKTGGNLAEALSNLSIVLRSRRLMAEKIKALSSEATASAGIIGAMPPGVMLMVLITTPAYMMLMFTDVRGQLMLMGGVLWMAAGIFVMKRMISFKF